MNYHVENQAECHRCTKAVLLRWMALGLSVGAWVVLLLLLRACG